MADKILVAAALLALVELSVLPPWPVLIILVREFIVSGIRMIAATKGEVIAASWYGKAKTVFQIIAIVLFIVKDSLVLPNFESVMQTPLYLLSWFVMLVALVLTIISMVDYIAKARHLIGFGPKGAPSKYVEPDEASCELSRDDVTDFYSGRELDERARILCCRRGEMRLREERQAGNRGKPHRRLDLDDAHLGPRQLCCCAGRRRELRIER